MFVVSFVIQGIEGNYFDGYPFANEQIKKKTQCHTYGRDGFMDAFKQARELTEFYYPKEFSGINYRVQILEALKPVEYGWKNWRWPNGDVHWDEFFVVPGYRMLGKTIEEATYTALQRMISERAKVWKTEIAFDVEKILQKGQYTLTNCCLRKMPHIRCNTSLQVICGQLGRRYAGKSGRRANHEIELHPLGLEFGFDLYTASIILLNAIRVHNDPENLAMLCSGCVIVGEDKKCYFPLIHHTTNEQGNTFCISLVGTSDFNKTMGAASGRALDDNFLS